MISFFPDLNVWVALSVRGHVHSVDAWNWLAILPKEPDFFRYTQVGLLRLLTNESVMGEQTLTLMEAWGVYDRWLSDPRVEYYPEPRGLDSAFRDATAPFADARASKWVGGCYLLACARQSGAAMVTFDRSLLEAAGKHGYAAIRPS